MCVSVCCLISVFDFKLQCRRERTRLIRAVQGLKRPPCLKIITFIYWCMHSTCIYLLRICLFCLCRSICDHFAFVKLLHTKVQKRTCLTLVNSFTRFHPYPAKFTVNSLALGAFYWDDSDLDQ